MNPVSAGVKASRMFSPAILAFALTFSTPTLSALISAAGSANNTYFILPVDTAVVRSIVPAEYPLLPVDETLFPGFPTGQRPALLVHGCDYNISSSLDLLFFSQSRLSFPFIDRLKDGKTAFGYQPFDLIDNPVAVLALVGTSGAIPVPASIQPPGISQQAAVAGDDGILHFSAQGLLANASESPAALNAGLLASVITAAFSVSSGLGPWSAEAYEASGNLPMFGPNTPLGTCFLHQEWVLNPSAFENVVGTIHLSNFPSDWLLPASAANIHGISAIRYFAEEFLLQCSSFAS